MSLNDALLVGGLQGFRDLKSDEVARVSGSGPVFERARQRFAGDESEHQVVDPMLRIEIEDRRDVWDEGDAEKGARFEPESLFQSSP